MTLPEQPAGGELGLDPVHPELYVQIIPPVSSVDILTNPTPYNDPSATQYGGVAGLVQPAPHVPTASERLHQIYFIDPTDDGTRPDSVLAPELEGAFDPR